MNDMQQQDETASTGNLPPDLSRGLTFLKTEVRKLTGDPGSTGC